MVKTTTETAKHGNTYLCILPHHPKPDVNSHHTIAPLVSNHSAVAEFQQAAGQFDKLHIWITGQEWGLVPESVLPAEINLHISLKMFPGTALPFSAQPPRASKPLIQIQNQCCCCPVPHGLWPRMHLLTQSWRGLNYCFICDSDGQIWSMQGVCRSEGTETLTHIWNIAWRLIKTCTATIQATMP